MTTVQTDAVVVAVYPPGSQGSYGPAQVSIAQKTYLTLEEATALSGLSSDYLSAKIQSGELKALQDGGVTKIRRSNIEGL